MSSLEISPDTDRSERFVRLLTKNERKVYGYILSLVPNWADADEILQETNVRLWQQFERYQPGTDFAAWACTVAYYQVQTFRKRKGRQRVRFSQEFVDAVAAEAASAQREADARKVALAGCMKKMKQASRQILELCYTRGMTIREAAEHLGRTADSTYKALSRIRVALHDCIERKLAGEG